jgi:hypothetical protein
MALNPGWFGLGVTCWVAVPTKSKNNCPPGHRTPNTGIVHARNDPQDSRLGAKVILYFHSVFLYQTQFMFFELIYYFTQDIVYNNYNKIAKQET